MILIPTIAICTWMHVHAHACLQMHMHNYICIYPVPQSLLPWGSMLCGTGSQCCEWSSSASPRGLRCGEVEHCHSPAGECLGERLVIIVGAEDQLYTVYSPQQCIGLVR